MSIDWSEAFRNIKRRNWSPFLVKLYEAIYSVIPHSGMDVVEEDWDYIIVLDACRYDTFKDVNWIDGELQKRKSKGAQTDEWLEKNFTGSYQDIVYVSANPHLSTTNVGSIDPEEQFHDYYFPYMRDECMEYGATKAECVNEDARKAVEEHPDKRVIIHYIQPHAPYIGEKRIGEGSLYNLYASGTPREEIVEAYRSNLKYVLENVEDLLPDLDGKVVITSDHGEVLGEKYIYGHKQGLYLKELVEVPWFVVDREEV